VPRIQELARDAVTVWPIRIDGVGEAAEARLAGVLSNDETARAARFRFVRDRRAFVVSRAALRLLLGAYLKAEPETLAFELGAHGKPHIAGATRVHFNVSHSGGLALAAFATGCEIGVDVEAIRTLPDRDAVARRFFHAEEAADLAALPERERDGAFFSCWTRKEALLKASGAGLTAPLDRFRVNLIAGEPARVLHVDGDTELAFRWNLHALPLDAGYAGAVAYRGPPRALALLAPLPAPDLLARFGGD